MLDGGSAEDTKREDIKSLAQEQWNVSAIQAESAKKGADSRKIRVAVLDSGVDMLSDVEFDYHTSLIPDENTDDRTGNNYIQPDRQ